jgi:hypothetical protein
VPWLSGQGTVLGPGPDANPGGTAAPALTGRVLTLDRADGQIRVLLLENIHPDAAARLVKDGYQVETAARALDEDELIAAIGGVHLLGVRSRPG